MLYPLLQVAAIQNQVNSQGKVVGQVYTIAPTNGASNGGTQVMIVPGSTAVPMAQGTQIYMVPPENAAAAAAAAGAMPPVAGSTIIAAETMPTPNGISSSAQAVGTQPGQPAIASASAGMNNGVPSGNAAATADGRTIAASTPAIFGKH